jgi:hypothetical protein
MAHIEPGKRITEQLQVPIWVFSNEEKTFKISI